MLFPRISRYQLSTEETKVTGGILEFSPFLSTHHSTIPVFHHSKPRRYRVFIEVPIHGIVKNKLKKSLASFPPRLLEVISESEHGNLMVVASSAMPGYVSGHYDPRTNRAYITTKAIMEDQGVAQEEITHLLDHLLGSNGKDVRLSNGYGRTVKLQLFGEEIYGLYLDKSNKISEYGDSNPHEFLGQAIRFRFTADPKLLQALAKPLYNVMEAKWFNNDFWREILE